MPAPRSAGNHSVRGALAAIACLAAILCLGSCGGSSSTPTSGGNPSPNPGPLPTVSLAPVVSGLAQPVALVNAGDARLFVVEQPGTIRIINNGALNSQPFLDIRSKVDSGGEKGLLGLAF